MAYFGPAFCFGCDSFFRVTSTPCSRGIPTAQWTAQRARNGMRGYTSRAARNFESHPFAFVALCY